jgi:hypothetical protein
MEKRKFLTLPGLEICPVGHPALSQSLYRLRCRGNCKMRPSFIMDWDTHGWWWWWLLLLLTGWNDPPSLNSIHNRSWKVLITGYSSCPSCLISPMQEHVSILSVLIFLRHKFLHFHTQKTMLCFSNYVGHRKMKFKEDWEMIEKSLSTKLINLAKNIPFNFSPISPLCKSTLRGMPILRPVYIFEIQQCLWVPSAFLFRNYRNEFEETFFLFRV